MRSPQAILHDYPGGQLLDEALQNAEDSSATNFALVLDQRQHADVDPRLAGPAFVLVDNGRGLGDREWMSLQNLNRSEKRECGRVRFERARHSPPPRAGVLTCCPHHALAAHQAKSAGMGWVHARTFTIAT